jgi:hypothetical protein
MLTSRPLRHCFEHFVSIPAEGGRFESLLGVRLWRQRRIQSQGWAGVQEYLQWLEASLNIHSMGIVPTTHKSVWLTSKLENWIDKFHAEKIIQIPGNL